MTIRAPFPWHGGKSMAARIVWERFGDVDSYCEPFAGSIAVLLGRPGQHDRKSEIVNDLDGFICNVWRAVLHDPERCAKECDWPVNENDLHARHAWLIEQREELTARLEGDPDYYDAKIAGYWLWGVACWIGTGWCGGKGPWVRRDGKLVHLVGRGVNRQLVHLVGRGVNRKLVHLGDWFRSLSDRLRFVRVCSGDWKRVVTPAALNATYSTHGIFLDPPYSVDDRTDCYAIDSRTVATEVREWCMTAPRKYRIALSGYAGEGHEALLDLGWTEHKWKGAGGMMKNKSDINSNRYRERIWFSPACLSVEQCELFG